MTNTRTYTPGDRTPEPPSPKPSGMADRAISDEAVEAARQVLQRAKWGIRKDDKTAMAALRRAVQAAHDTSEREDGE